MTREEFEKRLEVTVNAFRSSECSCFEESWLSGYAHGAKLGMRIAAEFIESTHLVVPHPNVPERCRHMIAEFRKMAVEVWSKAIRSAAGLEEER